MVNHSQVNGAESQLPPCSFSFDDAAWIEACLESDGRKAVGPLAHTPGWDFYDIAVDSFVSQKEKAVLRVRRQAPIRLVRIFSRWPSSEPPLAVALRPEGVRVADVALPPPVLKMERLLVAVCPSGSKAMDSALLAKCRKKELKTAAKSSQKQQRSGESLLASAAEAEAAELEAEIGVRSSRRATTLDNSSIGSRQGSSLGHVARRATAKSLAEAAAEVAAEFNGTSSSSGSGSGSRKSHKVLLQAAEEAAREAAEAEQIGAARLDKAETENHESTRNADRQDDCTSPAEEVKEGGQQSADLTPTVEPVSPSRSSPNDFTLPKISCYSEHEAEELSPADKADENSCSPSRKDTAGNESGKCDEGTEALLRSEIARLSAEVEEQRFARSLAEAQRKKIQEERDDFMRRLRCAERAQMLSDMQVRTLTSDLAEAKRQADTQRRHNREVVPSSLEDIVKALVTHELGQMRTCSPEERASTKKKLLLRWHPDKNSGVGCGDLLTRVLQEMQTRNEWTSS